MSGSPMRTRVRLSMEMRAEIAAARAQRLRAREQATVGTREAGQERRVSARTISAARRLEVVGARTTALRREAMTARVPYARIEEVARRAAAAERTLESACIDELEQQVVEAEAQLDRELDARLERIKFAEAVLASLPAGLVALPESLAETPDGLLFQAASARGGRLRLALEGTPEEGIRLVLDPAGAGLDSPVMVDGRMVTGCEAEEHRAEQIRTNARALGVESTALVRDDRPERIRARPHRAAQETSP
jgi:hypothetical protein